MLKKRPGDSSGAARLLLERTVAPLKATEPTVLVQMPDNTLTDQGRAVLAAVAAGTMAPTQGAALLASPGHPRQAHRGRAGLVHLGQIDT